MDCTLDSSCVRRLKKKKKQKSSYESCSKRIKIMKQKVCFELFRRVLIQIKVPMS